MYVLREGERREREILKIKRKERARETNKGEEDRGRRERIGKGQGDLISDNETEKIRQEDKTEKHGAAGTRSGLLG